MASKTKVSSAEKTIKDIRRETRRKWNAEEKIRIVLEGLALYRTADRWSG